MNSSLKIGLVCGIHVNMPGDDTGEYKAAIIGMQHLAAKFNFELIIYEAPLRSEEDAETARSFLDSQNVDLTIIFNASLPYGRIILPLAQVKSRLALWSIPEPTTTGVLQLNSYCGINMLGSILRNYFSKEDIKYKWLYGKTDSKMFIERFSVTLKALQALKALRTARIAQIGDLADGFENFYIDERILKNKFNTYIQTRHTVEEIVARAKKYETPAVDSEILKILKEGTIKSKCVSNTDFEKFARINLALNDFQQENNYDALAISCWSRFQEVYDIAICGALSRLNNRGIVAACEADIPSTVSMLMLNAMNGQHAALNDLVSLDESDNSLALWHCGVSPACFADNSGVTWDAHFNIGQYSENSWCGRGVVADVQYHEGEITIAGIDSDFEKMFCITGKVQTTKKGYNGSGAWVNELEINGSKTEIKDLINTISVAEINHHYPTTFMNLTNEINEFAFWSDTSVISKQEYTPYMQPFI